MLTLDRLPLLLESLNFSVNRKWHVKAEGAATPSFYPGGSEIVYPEVNL